MNRLRAPGEPGLQMTPEQFSDELDAVICALAVQRDGLSIPAAKAKLQRWKDWLERMSDEEFARYKATLDAEIGEVIAKNQRNSVQ